MRIWRNVNQKRLGKVVGGAEFPSNSMSLGRNAGMSALGYKRKSEPGCRHVRLSPETRHQELNVSFRVNFVRLALSSRRSGQVLGMSEIDPERNISTLVSKGSGEVAFYNLLSVDLFQARVEDMFQCLAIFVVPEAEV